MGFVFLNTFTTKVIGTMQNTGKINIKIDGKNNEQVNEYKHLGAIIQNDIYKTIFKTVYRSTLMYDNEAWTVNAT